MIVRLCSTEDNCEKCGARAMTQIYPLWRVGIGGDRRELAELRE